MSDAYTVRVTALVAAFNAWAPFEITKLDFTITDPATEVPNLCDQDVLDHLELAADLLISEAFALLVNAINTEFQPPRDLARLTMAATRFTQAFVDQLGGVVVPNSLTDAVVAAATYQLALKHVCKAAVDLNSTMFSIVDAANSPV